MLELRTGDILCADTEALVNTVNCVGIMGRGIALQFKKAFPSNFKVYQAACERGDLRPGHLLVHRLNELGNPRYIINFPTKLHWKGKSQLEFIDAGLDALVSEVRRLGIRSIAIPPLGCGLGGLDWSVVRPRIELAVAQLPNVHAAIYEPSGAPKATEMVKAEAPARMTPARAIVVGMMQRYLSALLDPTVTLLEVQKLMYFMQEAGEALRLKYRAHVYGPYAENLRHVLSPIEGHLIEGYADGGDQPDKELALLPGAADAAITYLLERAETWERFDRVAELVEGFETPFGMELLATVHWAAKGDARSLAEVTAATHQWSERKRMFTPQHINVAYERLRDKGWLQAA